MPSATFTINDHNPFFKLPLEIYEDTGYRILKVIATETKNHFYGDVFIASKMTIDTFKLESNLNLLREILEQPLTSESSIDLTGQYFDET